MKPTRRTNRVPSSIKSEDTKPDLTAAELITIITADDNTNDLTIKQEETINRKSLLEQDGGLEMQEYYYRCDKCNTSMQDLALVLEHRRSIHGVKESSNRVVKNISIEPNIHDPNFYCQPCERGYRNRNAYRRHLRLVHFMVLEPIPSWKTPRDDIIPDPNDPSLYCGACNRSYSHKYTYKAHCLHAHGVKPANATQRSSSSSSTRNTYCQACDKRYATVDCYRRHLFGKHNIDSRPKPKKRKDILPDVNDPNFYCRSCDKKFASKVSFQGHIKLIHAIFQSAPRKKSRFKPDVDDANNYCRVCQKTSATRGQYRIHLRLVHRMTLPLLTANASNSEELPDPYNRDLYCSVCCKTYASRRLYRQHCKTAHFMVLSSFSIVNPQATINIHDPDFHCAQCEHSFTSKVTFANHLKLIHSI